MEELNVLMCHWHLENVILLFLFLSSKDEKEVWGLVRMKLY